MLSFSAIDSENNECTSQTRNNRNNRAFGYVGLPTAIGFHDAGFTVWGVDVSS